MKHVPPEMMKMNDVSEHQTHEIFQTHEKEFISSYTFRVFRDFGVFRVHIFFAGSCNLLRNTDKVYFHKSSS
jgi:hypothetical protein